jgi:CheY-like chemotaxis protein
MHVHSAALRSPGVLLDTNSPAQKEAARPQLLLAVRDPDLPKYALPAYAALIGRSTAEVLALLERADAGALVIDADDASFDGVAVCRAAAANPQLGILVTTRQAERVPPLLKAGCHAVLLKPFPPNLLAARVGRLLRARSQTNRAWPDTLCPRCFAANATSFEFTSYRRMWLACLACEFVWVGPRQE